MRLVQVTIPAGKRRAVLDALDEEGVDYVLTEETSGGEYTAVVSFPLPTEAVEPVLASLREAGLDEDAYTIVLDAETVISREFEELRKRYAGEEDEGDAIATAELRQRAEEFASGRWRFLVLTFVSAVIATAGVLLDSAVVVVGANVIVPLMDPAMAASVGTVIRDRDLFVRGVRRQALGLGVAIAGATGFALLARSVPLVPPNLELLAIHQVRQGMTANVLSLVVALGAGVAGAVSLVSGVSSTLVGVAIAVALIPPAATLGIGLAWANPVIVVGAGVLLLVNVLSINFAALIVFWRAGYRPRGVFTDVETRSVLLKRGAALLLGILVLSAFLGGVTLTTVQTATFEQRVDEEVTAVLDRPEYADLVLLDVEVRYERDLFFRHPDTVLLTVGRTTDDPHPELADAVADQLAPLVEGEVTVRIRFVEVSTVRVS